MDKRILKKTGIIIGGLLLAGLASNSLAILTSNTYSTDLESSSTQYWSITDASQSGLDLTSNDFTISAWINVESITDNGCGSDAILTIVNKGSGQANKQQYILSVCDSAAGGSAWAYQGGHSHNCTNTPNLVQSSNFTGATATWFHTVMVASSTSPNVGDIAFFTNGALTSFHAAADNSYACDSDQDFQIGEATASATYDPFDGLIDDVRVWSRALTEAQINSLYTDPCNFDDGVNLMGRWLFDNNGNDDNATTTPNNLTNNNSATFSTTVAYSCGAAADEVLNTFIQFIGF